MPSIYDSIGGRDAVAAAVDGLYARLLADDQLAPYFSHSDMRRQKAHMRAFLAIALGGPEIYRGRDMTAAHAHLTITDETFDRVVDHVVATLAALGVPGETIAEIGAAVAPLREQIVTPAVAA